MRKWNELVYVKMFPIFQDAKIEQVEVDYNPEFIKKMIQKLDWAALKSAAESVSILFTGEVKLGIF